MNKLLIIGTPYLVDVKKILNALSTEHGATFEAITVTDRDDVIKNWGDNMSDPLGDIAKLQLVLQENDYTPTISGPEKLLMSLAAEQVFYDTFPEAGNINVAGLPDQNNKPWYQDRKHYRNKKSRRKL